MFVRGISGQFVWISLLKNSERFGPNGRIEAQVIPHDVVSWRCRLRISWLIRRHQMSTTFQEKASLAPNVQASTHRALSIKHRPRSKRYYFDVGLGSVCLAGADTGGAYCLLEVSLAPGIGVPRHTHTREDETYHVTSGELEVIVGEEVFVLKPGDTLMAPRNIPHELRNSGNAENHYLLFSPS